MAIGSSNAHDMHMPAIKVRVAPFRWLAVLVGCVTFLVLILLRSPYKPIDSDVTAEIAERLNEEASKLRWSLSRAQQWYSSQPWYLGANYLPSTAVNVLEMWQDDTFDEKTIKCELAWASKRLQMNIMRVFLHILVWMNNPTKFFQHVDTFLSIAKQNNIKVMLVLFDECWNEDPKLGQQLNPIPGVHNSRWVRCPGQSMVLNRTSWPLIAQYTTDVINHYKSDNRVAVWDLYNEPECSKQIRVVLPLLRYIYKTARSVADVEQPMTIGIAKWPLTTPLAQFELAASDIISFHSYGPLANVIANVSDLRQVQLGRPILCTEWLARTFGSTLFTHIDFFQTEKIGAIHWGLVAGRSQTYYQWKSPKGAPTPKMWFHDVLYSNGTAFSALEEKLYSEIKHEKVFK
ncbi:unnamed protein product [Adineta ricciae]|uniref:Glycoside hydrolase family 5 domain-containing protein n=2 Tax=Adineta ricciae TaxID=249248 RepID=A0A813Q0N9_ADIRI|nr:unnamed protein product [Adineta ricciae]